MVIGKSSISWLKKKKKLKNVLASIKTKVDIKFPNFFFFPQNRLGAERVKHVNPKMTDICSSLPKIKF